MSDALRRGLRTAAQTFVGMFGVSLLGWFASVQSWAGDTTGHFPSVNPLGKAAAAALASAASGVVSFLMNKAEDSPKIALPAVLKAEPSAGVNPVTTDPVAT